MSQRELNLPDSVFEWRRRREILPLENFDFPGGHDRTDIDLFADEQVFSDTIKSGAWDEVCEALNQRLSDGSISDLKLTPTGFSYETPKAPVSFFSMPRMTTTPISSEQEDATGTPTESSAEIVFKKLRGRKSTGVLQHPFGLCRFGHIRRRFK